MNEELGKILERRHAVLVEEKDEYIDGMKEKAKYFAPHLAPRLESEDPEKGKELTAELFDSTTLSAVSIATNGTIGYTMNQSAPWMHISTVDRHAMKDLEVKKWLQHATIHLYGCINNSNFYNVLPAYVEQGWTVGPGILYREKNVEENRYVFSARGIGECYTSLNAYMENDTLNRVFKESLRNLKARFGVEVLPESYRSMAEGAETQYEMVQVLHSVYPSTDGKWASIGKKYVSVYQLLGEEGVLSEQGYDDFPYSIWNWHLNSEETYPRTPADIALPDARGINEMAKSMLKAGQMMIEPPIDVPVEMKGKVHNYPRGVNYYSDASRIVKPHQGPSQIPYADGIWEKKKGELQDHFFVDFFKMLNQLTQRMTTVEVMERQSEKVALIGVPIAKFLTDGPDGIIEGMFRQEMAEGRIPPPPTGLGGEALEIIHTGPLAMLQERLAKGQQVTRAFQELQPVFQQFPQSGAKIKFDELVAYLMEAYNFPAEAIKTDRELKAEQAKAQEEAQRQQSLEQTEVMGKALPGFAKAQEMTGGEPTQPMV